MALAIVYPLEVYEHLRRTMWAPEPKTETMFTQQFLSDNGLTEHKIRARAQFERITLTDAFRAYMVEKHPEIGPMWPVTARTPKQIAGIARRSKSPEEASDLPKVLKVLARLVSNPHDLRARTDGAKLLGKHGVPFDTKYLNKYGK